ncbi:signal recognition particle receptor FtsY-like [Ylistrum balloti]|uniref:signal recognition particle receptor FtsY-like n=1 Tax=Ylistrum balloti TaxID=509963 RepID=UPI0029058764|nr:signal recognition particle receptor FtsY-like [Ylistrum balloti]
MGLISNIITFVKGTESKKNIAEVEDMLLGSGLSPSLAFSISKALQRSFIGASKRDDILRTVRETLQPLVVPYTLQPLQPDTLHVLFLLGVNGVGKTSTVAKIAYMLAKNKTITKQSMLFCASDTFRTAAVEQLSVHADALDIDIYKGTRGQDPSAVIYASLEHAKKEKKTLVLIDSAGRMNTRKDLMQQLEKNYRIIQKHVKVEELETFVVVDGNSGLNTINQAKDFNTLFPVHAMICAKYDGGGSGGAIPNIYEACSIPCAFLGTGEGYQDLMAFERERFLDEFLS